MAHRKRKGFAGVRIVFALIVLGVIAISTFFFFKMSDNTKFESTFYRVVSEKIKTGVRAVLLSDLHNSQFGENNSELVEEIRRLDPDLILMAGDMVNGDDSDISVILSLCSNLGDIAPVYYAFGNHEGNLTYLEDGPQIPLDTELLNVGVNVLYGEPQTLKVRGNNIVIGRIGANDQSFSETDRQEVEKLEEMEGFKILVSHYPTLFYEKLAEVEVDLAVAGHFHGGLIVLPGDRGLFHEDVGFFPKYCFGQFQLKNATLVVSRGLGNHGIIPRVNNCPELVVIDISHV